MPVIAWGTPSPSPDPGVLLKGRMSLMAKKKAARKQVKRKVAKKAIKRNVSKRKVVKKYCRGPSNKDKESKVKKLIMMAKRALQRR